MKQTIIIPEGRKGTWESPAPLGMCCQDRIESSKMPYFCVGKNISGVKIDGELNIWQSPIIDVMVGNGTYFSNLKATIDTGAFYNHINRKFVEKMNAIQDGELVQSTPYGNFKMPSYPLVFGFSDFSDTQFVGKMQAMDYEGVDMLIGTLFLSQFCDFRYFGKENRFELIFN
jgi:hypothetical protein